MPSMSYCMFENTETEMRQLLDKMKKTNTFEDLDLNQYEVDAFNNLYNLCQKYRQHWERLTSEMEEE